MAHDEIMTLKEARESINQLVQGVDPYSGEVLEEIGYLNDPRMIRCLAVVSDVLTRCIEGENHFFKKEAFLLKEEMISKLELPEGEIGVMKIVNAINKIIDRDNMKKLSAFALNKKLIEEGILSYSDVEGSKRAVVNETSKNHGIISIKATFNGESYDKVIYTDDAKVFIKENLIKWFG